MFKNKRCNPECGPPQPQLVYINAAPSLVKIWKADLKLGIKQYWKSTIHIIRTSKEDNLTGRWPHRKMTSLEDDLTRRQPCQKMNSPSPEDDLNKDDLDLNSTKKDYISHILSVQEHHVRFVALTWHHNYVLKKSWNIKKYFHLWIG